MENLSGKPEGGGGDLFPIMMVNAGAWAVAIIVSLVVLGGTRYMRLLFPVLAGGACVAIVATSITWRRRKQKAS